MRIFCKPFVHRHGYLDGRSRGPNGTEVKGVVAGALLIFDAVLPLLSTGRRRRRRGQEAGKEVYRKVRGRVRLGG